MKARPLTSTPSFYHKRELEYRVPRLHFPKNSRRCSDISVRTKQVSCRYSWKNVFSRLLPYISVENRSAYPVLKSSLISREFRWEHLGALQTLPRLVWHKRVIAWCVRRCITRFMPDACPIHTPTHTPIRWSRLCSGRVGTRPLVSGSAWPIPARVLFKA